MERNMKTATPFDISEYLDSEDKISAYLTAILEDNDMDLFIQAIGHVAKARGMTKIANETGLGRESLYKSFAGNAQPKFDTVVKVLNAMNISMQFVSSLDVDSKMAQKPHRGAIRNARATKGRKSLA